MDHFKTVLRELAAWAVAFAATAALIGWLRTSPETAASNCSPTAPNNITGNAHWVVEAGR